jgi:hypothetical protein
VREGVDEIADLTPFVIARSEATKQSSLSLRPWIASLRSQRRTWRPTVAASPRPFSFRTHFVTPLTPRFSVGQHLFEINESLTLDSPAKLDSNRCDSEASGVLPDVFNLIFYLGV